MQLGIRLDASLRAPLYQQLVNELSRKIDSGELSDGDRLPSVRDLAVEVRINPNTVARAYQELEKLALVRSQPGRGVFVALPSGPGAHELPGELEALLERLIEVAQIHGFPPERLELELRHRILMSRKES
ncbi:MAG: GntR family transcriptional regulator [Holophagales bacterium]|nr:GntR family transcriptional regulator [Holophagales bacterium]